jgi:hypothetical protein
VKIKKTVLAQREMIYAISTLTIDGHTHVLAATELEGDCLLFSPPDWKASVVWSEPGGTMSLLPIPDWERVFLAIQRFYPIFLSEKACIVLVQARQELTAPWSVKHLVDLPYVHRLETVKVGSTPYLIAATLCQSKDFQEDWSKPGALYASRIREDNDEPWTLTPIVEGITKNHGLHVAIMDGKEVILVGGSEGLFRVEIPGEPDGSWKKSRLIDHEVSDMYVTDLDDDGRPEIVAIEPFHGDKLVIYKELRNQWQRVAEKQIHFGHVAWAGKINGKTCVVVGSRGGPKNLELLYLEKPSLLAEGRAVFQPVEIDRGVGPTQIAVVHEQEGDLVFSANHGAGEVVLYELYEDD